MKRRREYRVFSGTHGVRFFAFMADRALPSGVLGPVLRPPCRPQRPFRYRSQRLQGVPRRARAPHLRSESALGNRSRDGIEPLQPESSHACPRARSRSEKAIQRLRNLSSGLTTSRSATVDTGAGSVSFVTISSPRQNQHPCFVSSKLRHATSQHRALPCSSVTVPAPKPCTSSN